MKRITSILLILFSFILGTTIASANAEKTDAWHFLHSFVDADAFTEKHMPITRAQAAYALAQFEPNTPLSPTSYKDVPTTHRYYKEIMQVTALGVFSGYENQTFNPDANLTREQLAKILVLFFNVNAPVGSPVFQDVPSTTWSYEYVQKLSALRITTGTTPTTFTPTAYVTQAQFSLFLYRFDNLAPSTMTLSNSKIIAGHNSYGYKDGAATSALFRFPQGITKINNGYMITDTENHLLRKLQNNSVSTYAGNSFFYHSQQPISYLKNGHLKDALFQSPTSIISLQDGSLLVADSANHVIRKITKDGFVSTFAGTGEAGLKDGEAKQAQFFSPQGLAIAKDGTVYVADTFNHVIRKISPRGIVSTLTNKQLRQVNISLTYTEFAGSYVDGPFAQARFNEPTNLIVDASGNLYVSDSGNHVIRYMNFTTNIVSTYAGQFIDAGVYGQGDYLDGKATTARFSYPKGLALLPNGELLVADSNNNAIRLISNRDVSTVSLAESQPSALLVDSNTLLIVNRGSNQVRSYTLSLN